MVRLKKSEEIHRLCYLDKPRIPDDFNPDQACLFCVNREEYLPKKHPHIIEIEDENSPLDLSLKSTTNSK